MDLYNIPYEAAPKTNNRLVVPGFLGQYANEQNLEVWDPSRFTAESTTYICIKVFLNTFRPDMDNKTTWTLESIDGGLNPQTIADAGDEAVRTSAVFSTMTN